MKLIYSIAVRLSLATMLLLACWAAFFYLALVDEINDEADDALEDYSELLIVRMLAGRPLPEPDNGSNNSYWVVPVTARYAEKHPAIAYFDTDFYIPEKDETEPARVLKTVFGDGDGNMYELTVATPTFEKDDLLRSVLWWVVFLYAVLLLTVVGLTVWVFQRNIRPLYVLLEWLDGYKVGNARPLDNPTRITEFRRLNEAAGKAAARTDALFARQKEFIGNASHELQTPLAVCRGRLELLLDGASLTEEQAAEVFAALRTLDRAVKLNRTLLLLSKIDNGQFVEGSEVDMGALLGEQAALCSEVYASRNMECVVSADAPLTLTINETLAAVIAGNLVRNAYVHAPRESRIDVRITADGFSVANDAAAGPLDGARVFERFYRSGEKEGSSGLGLALVETACRHSGLKADYAYLGGRHVFTVRTA